MKFGETLLDLQVEAWREYYLDYRALKALLKPCKKLSTEDANYDDKLTAISDAFLSALDTQLSRVNTFFAEKQGEAAELLWAQQDAEPQDGKTERKQAKHDYEELNDQLADFVELNYVAVFKIMKKFDKQTGLHKSPAIMASLMDQPFCSEYKVSNLKKWSNNFKELHVHAKIRGHTRDIKQSAQLLQEAVAMVHHSTDSAPLEVLDTAVIDTCLRSYTQDIQPLPNGKAKRLALLTAKSNLFSTYVEQMRKELDFAHPEAASALALVLRTHDILFAVHKRKKSIWQTVLEEDEEEKVEEEEEEAKSETAISRAMSNIDMDQDDDEDLGEEEEDDALCACLGVSGKDGYGAFWRAAQARLLEYVPIVSWLPEYDYKRDLQHDVIAGLTIAVYGVPQGLAYALLAGLPVYYGLYTVFLPGIIYMFFGTSKHLAIGCLSIPALLIGTVVTDALGHGSSNDVVDPLFPDRDNEAEYVAAVMLITFMIGVVFVALGFLRLGFVMDFISSPVLSGFASGAAIITLFSVSKDILGVHAQKSAFLLKTISAIGGELSHTNWTAVAIGLTTIVLLVLLKQHPKAKKLPAALIVVVVGILFSLAVNLKDTTKVELIGDVPRSLPTPALPGFTGDLIVEFAYNAVFIGFVGFLESISMAKIFAAKHDYTISASQELVALGITNIVGSFFLSFPTMGGFSRSSINEQVGARSAISQLVSGLTVMLIILFAGPAVSLLPKPVLAAIVVMAMVHLVDLKGALALWRVDRGDLFTMGVSFIGTLVLGVQLGVVVAVGVSVLLFMYNASRPKQDYLARISGTIVYKELADAQEHDIVLKHVDGVKILSFYGPLFFANATGFTEKVEEAIQLPCKNGQKVQALVLDCGGINRLDSSGLNAIEYARRACYYKHVVFAISSPHKAIRKKMKRIGVAEHIPVARRNTLLESTHPFKSKSFVPRFASVHDAAKACIKKMDELQFACGLANTKYDAEYGIVPSPEEEGKAASQPLQSVELDSLTPVVVEQEDKSSSQSEAADLLGAVTVHV